MNIDLVSGSHAIGQSLYHLEFCPKYRYKSMRSEHVKSFLEHAFKKISEKYKIPILAMKVMSDHVHLFVDIPPTYSISQVFQYFKGISAHEIFENFPGFRMRYHKGHFWSPGKFYRSIGVVNPETISHYIENQVEAEQQMRDERQTALEEFS